MVETDSGLLSFAEDWLIKSNEAVLSHWNSTSKTFIRNSENHDKPFYSTATFQSIYSLGFSGIWLPKKDLNSVIETPYFKLRKTGDVLTIDVINGLIKRGKGTEKNWVRNLLSISSHIQDDGGEIGNLRTALVLELLLCAINSLKVKDIKGFEPELAELKTESLALIGVFLKDIIDEAEPGQTPASLIHVVNCILQLQELYTEDSFAEQLNVLHGYVNSHIDYHMARCNTTSSSFDPISLAIALSGKIKLESQFRFDPLFHTCLEVIAKSQHANGCWPDGISLTFSVTGDVVQQPSVGVAVSIAESAIDYSFLSDHDSNIEKILSIVLPGLRKTAQYLANTFEEVVIDGKTISGWSSDRIRKRKYTEAWITSLANRLFFRLWIAEKSLARYTSLKKLGVKTFKSQSQSSADIAEKWHKIIIDPDQITNPTAIVFDKFIIPILNQKDSGYIIHKLAKDGVSFIIFGPPGSGKTYFIENLARVLDWPLVELSPGHFIKNGLELIEATSREIFDLLDGINHAVVFFDECDELFRERGNDSTARSILSFATASMLPKLQKLHDARKVIFVLGTNFLHKIDMAIRRPGRFDNLLLFDRPDERARREFFISKGVNDKDGLATLVAKTVDYTFQELGNHIDGENSVDEYRKWCQETGIIELPVSRLSDDNVAKIKAKWKIKPKA